MPADPASDRESAVANDTTEGCVQIRTSRHRWVGDLVMSGFYLMCAAFVWTSPAQFWRGAWLALVWLVLGCAGVVEALWLRTRGVDLTDEAAVLRGFRRRTIAWRDVQAVVCTQRFGWVVQLVPAGGKPVTLRAPTTSMGKAVSEYERDFHRIEQWWLTHRGPSWSPAPPRRDLR
jgi:hypothetical protein